MFRGLRVGVVLVVSATMLAACTSSGPAKQSASPSSPAPSTSSVITSATPTPTPTPTPSSTAPLSPFEQDPAVKAMRAWAAQAARTVNSGHYNDAALSALMTAGLGKTMRHVFNGDVGLYYPGPLPFTPVSVKVVSATERDMRLCVVGTGFAEKRTTHRPAEALKVLPINAAAVLSSGRWLISKQDTASDFSCSRVAVARPRWS